MNWIQASKKAGWVFLLVLSACTTEVPTGNPGSNQGKLNELSLPNGNQSANSSINSDLSQVRVKNTLRWQITPVGKSGPTSTLIGTVHAPLAEGYQFPADLTQAIQNAEAFYIEADLDQVAQAAEDVLPQAIDPQQDLSSVLSAEALQTLNQRLSSKGFPAQILPFLRPWFINLILGSAPEGLIPDNLDIMDLQLLKQAKQNQRPLRYLEEAIEPLHQMQSIPAAEHIKVLKTTLAQSKEKTIEEFTQIFTLYNTGDLAQLNQLNADSRAESEAFYQHLIINRNQAWLQKIKPVLQTEAVVIAVGSLHLLGTDGLLEQIKQAGFTVQNLNKDNN